MKARIALIFALIIFLLPVTARAFWIWTPKSGKWVNPKAEAKETPEAQFDFAKSLYDEKKYDQAAAEFKKLLNKYPKSYEASESQYYLGLIDEEKGNLWEAYQGYQKVIDKYPFSSRIQEIIEREYNIAEAFMSGKKRKAFGLSLPVENPAIEIFTKVIENSTYGTFAPKAQYKLGLVLKSLMRYYEAEEAFAKIVNNYPKSEWVEAAKYQIALCRQTLSRGPEYDQGATQEAKEKFRKFVLEHPDAVLAREAEKNISQLRRKEAEGNFEIGRFYEKQKEYGSAGVYYKDIIENYSDTEWAAKALERLQIMEK